MGKDPQITRRLSWAVLFAIIGSATTYASSPSEDSGEIRWQAVAERIDSVNDEDRQIAAALDEWRRLTRSDAAGFAAYADFLAKHPGWPEENRLRSAAERAINPQIDDPATIVAFFKTFPARTAQGSAANAIALARLGRMEDARVAARDAWASGTLPLPLEQAFLARFSSSLTPVDHLRHVDAALWRGATDAAERALPFTPVTRQAVVSARIAMQRKAADAADKIAAADPVGVMDAGYIADKARWMAGNGDEAGARALLAERLPLAQTPADPEKWYEIMLARAKATSKEDDWALTYAIASRVDDAYAPATDISAQPLGARDAYTSLTWIAGYAAYHHLNRPSEAESMFARYAAGGQGASTKAKGYYWAGRAALLAGHQESARDYFAKAGTYPDQYYGQLALERLGKPVPAPVAKDHDAVLSTADRKAFEQLPIVRAAQYLGKQGAWGDQSKFVRAIALSAETERDHLLVDRLAQSIGRPDLGVIAGRRATASGLSGYDSGSFPRLKVPDSERDNWTMIHAIARQESQFDRQIVSYAGARGLMQLMPTTAREQAGKVGLSYNIGSLFDPDYNVMLGSTYFVRLLRYYQGSYPLAVAAYNAGMGNVNKWLKANGDPRLPGGDIVQWVEDIPVYQTKDYVQRVLENAVVYDMMNPMKDSAQAPTSTPLSRYLGKSTPG